MSKVKYYFDPNTLSYRPIEITNTRRVSNFILFLLASFAFGLCSLLNFLNINWINTPSEISQKRALDNYELQFDILDKKLKQIESFIANLE